MMRKNGSSALKSSRSVIVVVRMGPVYVHACAVRRAKSANLIGGAPVTFWTRGYYGSGWWRWRWRNTDSVAGVDVYVFVSRPTD